MVAGRNKSQSSKQNMNGHGKTGVPKSSNADLKSSSMVDALQNSLLFRVLMPAFLITICPNFILWLWYTVRFHNGSMQEFAVAVISSPNPLKFLASIWGHTTPFNSFSVTILGGYFVYQLLLMKIIPGPRAVGPITPKGNTPVYVDNGFSIFMITMGTFAGLTYYLKTYTSYSPSMVYDHYGDILATLNIFSLLFCVFLYFKGMVAPSSTDSSTSGNPIFDYYWGTELYPRVFGWDIKVLTNCRFGCTVWAIFPCCFALKVYEQSGFEASFNTIVSTIILMVYLVKFFWWEAGYMCTIDIILDRAGFYICWGCLCWIPGLYTVFSFHMATHPSGLGYYQSLAILAAGLTCVAINYAADWQKQAVRATNGQCTVWGRKPEIILAKYQVQGKERTSLLLTSGFWGLARHFHYLPELGLAFFWTLPAGLTHVLPYSYFIFLLVLLVHRTYRDDIKCGDKYGKYWKEYQKKVPFRIIPYIF